MLDLERRDAASHCFQPYRVESIAVDLDRWRWRTSYDKRSLGLANEHDYYARLIAKLAQCKRLIVAPFRQIRDPLPKGRSVVFLRHDIDIDPFSALALSATLRDAGVAGTFFVLHTAPFYSTFDSQSGIVKRHHNIVELLRQIHDRNGCEVGLHVDGLGVYMNYRLDGAAAVVAELEWLRESGLRIFGTAAHNSATEYGAENFELFIGRSVGHRTSVVRNDIRVPLQQLDEKALGLFYEANEADTNTSRPGPELDAYLNYSATDPSRDENWMRLFLLDNPLCTWFADYNIWLIGRDRWVIAGKRGGDPLFRWDASLDDVFLFLDHVPMEKRIVFHVHPFYIGLPDHPLRARPSRPAALSAASAEFTAAQWPEKIFSTVAPKIAEGLRCMKVVGASRDPASGSKSQPLTTALEPFCGPVAMVNKDQLMLPLPDRSIDLVVLEDALIALPPPQWAELFSEIWRVLDHHGLLVGVEARIPKPDDKIEYRRLGDQWPADRFFDPSNLPAAARNVAASLQQALFGVRALSATECSTGVLWWKRTTTEILFSAAKDSSIDQAMGQRYPI